MSKAKKSTPVATGNAAANPTWYGDIRHLFTSKDIAHMNGQGVDLTSYDFVKTHAGQIYQQVAAGNMPPKNAWSKPWVATFLAWMTNGCPKGTPARTALFASGKRLLAAAPVKVATRIRKDVTTLTAAEKTKLIKAFTEIKSKPATDPNSYFVLAGYHWYPSPNTYCMHHVPGYNPWHRAYLLLFENALRSVPGCEDVTLPYWDITKPFPDLLKTAPFDSYTYPEDVGPAPYYNLKGQKTFRDTYDNIAASLLSYKVTDKINNALSQTDWEDFHGIIAGATNDAIISAHDSGHNSIGGTNWPTHPNGGTMTDQSVAAFDPIFWFFHCNWDRLFWVWQQKMEATTLDGLLSTINKEKDPLSYQTFTDAAVMILPPFKQTAVEVIDSIDALDVDYTHPKLFRAIPLQPKHMLSTLATQSFKVGTDLVDVRVNGLNRLKIPGSFDVHLVKNDKIIASTGFFQPSEVEKCASCVKNAIINFDFKLPLSDVSSGKLGIWVEPVNKEVYGDHFPSKLMGNPTVEIKFVVSTE